MQNIDHDTEEYQDARCSRSDNGFDTPEYDRFEYEDLAEQIGLITVSTEVIPVRVQ